MFLQLYTALYNSFNDTSDGLSITFERKQEEMSIFIILLGKRIQGSTVSSAFWMLEDFYSNYNKLHQLCRSWTPKSDNCIYYLMEFLSGNENDLTDSRTSHLYLRWTWDWMNLWFFLPSRFRTLVWKTRKYEGNALLLSRFRSEKSVCISGLFLLIKNRWKRRDIYA